MTGGFNGNVKVSFRRFLNGVCNGLTVGNNKVQFRLVHVELWFRKEGLFFFFFLSLSLSRF